MASISCRSSVVINAKALLSRCSLNEPESMSGHPSGSFSCHRHLHVHVTLHRALQLPNRLQKKNQRSVVIRRVSNSGALANQNQDCARKSRQSIAKSGTLEDQNSAHGSVVSLVHVRQNSSPRQCLERHERQGHQHCVYRSVIALVLVGPTSSPRQCLEKHEMQGHQKRAHRFVLALVLVGPISSPRQCLERREAVTFCYFNRCCGTNFIASNVSSGSDSKSKS